MSEILYVKPEKNVRTYNRVLTLGEAVEMQCADPTIVNRLKTEKLYAFQEVKPGRRSCAGRTAISILDVVEKIQAVYPNLEIQNLGEMDFGEEVEIRTYRMVDRQKEFRGVLKAWDKDTVTIETEDGQEQIFDRDNIALIRLAFDF